MTEIWQHGVDVITLGSLYAILGLGIALIFGIMRLVNFAYGELVMVGGYAALAVGNAPWPVVVFIIVAFPILFSVLMERVAFRPVRGAPEATMLLTSFAVSYLLQNVALLAFGSSPQGVSISSSLNSSIVTHGVVIPKLSIATVATTLVLLVCVSLFLGRTALGVQMRAAAEDFTTARTLGINANRVIVSAFALSGLLAGVASYFIVSQSGSVFPAMGLNAILIAFIATVLGGMGSLSGAVLGGYALALITVVLDATLSEEMRSYREAFTYAIVIVVLLWRPEGIISPRSARERV